MRKPKTQPAFATLTEAEIDQIAEWLRHDTYDIVLERVRKPRADGGFGLDISRSPLERLHAKTNKLDQINRRIVEGQKLTIFELDAINGGERDDVTDEVHHAIMDATYDLATSGDNTPAQLLALQRLADFPARAEYRAHRQELDTRMRAHKIEMDLHRKHITDERLELSKRSLALRESQIAARSDQTKSAFRNGQSGSDPHSAIPSDDLGPYAANLDEIEERARRKFGLPLPHRRPAKRDEETLEKNDAPSGRDAFHRVPNTSESNPSSSATSAVENSASSSSPLPSLASVPENPCPSVPSVVNDSPSLPSSPSSLNPPSLTPLPSGLDPKIISYTIRRWRSFLPRRYHEPKPDHSWVEECPCGAQLPCDLHGILWRQVRYLRPSDTDYAAALTRHGIPVYVPKPEELQIQTPPVAVKKMNLEHSVMP